MSRRGRLPVKGADLYYDVEGVGPAMVLVHGFTLDGRMWDEQVAALRDIATVVRLDLRGFGRSSDPAPGVAYAHSADLLALLDHLNIRSAVLVGLSMGGLVVLHSALVAPQRVRGLVLLNSVLDDFAWDDASRLATRAAEHAVSTHGVPAAKDVWLEHPLFAPARRDAALATGSPSWSSCTRASTGRTPILPNRGARARMRRLNKSKYQRRWWSANLT